MSNLDGDSPATSKNVTNGHLHGVFEMTGDKINDVKPIIIEKFDRKGNFTLWQRQRKMKNDLIQQDLQHAILGVEKKLAETTNAQWK
ncbi:hypothetical protein LWI28_001190 [Acer negundo]|uniref:Uncharacterized protein n=1 Tax=Acer negundo TaxID=4023 RepID=A0AAD5NVF4_ACENE|nr:hypothetical protein LWI28_001190 [Acer negundo]